MEGKLQAVNSKGHTRPFGSLGFPRKKAALQVAHADLRTKKVRRGLWEVWKRLETLGTGLCLAEKESVPDRPPGPIVPSCIDVALACASDW